MAEDDAGALGQPRHRVEQAARPAARRSSARGAGEAGGRRMALPIAAAMAVSPLEDVRARIAKAAALAGRKPDEVTLIAVSKTQPAEAIEALIGEGQRVFGENRVQEAEAKWPALRRGPSRYPPPPDRPAPVQQGRGRGRPVRRHPFGGPALAWSPRSPRRWKRPAAAPIASSRSISATSRRKAAARVAELPALLERCAEADLPARGPDVHPARRRRGRALFRAAGEAGAASWRRRPLSMGMSADYESAVMIGATHVRVGTALFGPRQ